MKRAEIEDKISDTINDSVDKHFCFDAKLAEQKLTALFIQLSEELETKAIEACKNVVETYEFDGMEQMRTRDEVFYKTCKEAIS